MQEPTEFKSVPKSALKLLVRTYGKVVLLSLFIMLICMLCVTFLMADGYWNRFLLENDYLELMQVVEENPEYSFTSEESALINSYIMVITGQLLIYSFFQFLGPLVLIGATVWYLHEVGKGKEEPSLFKSLKMPLVENRGITTIFLTLIAAVLIPLGFFFFVIPGFILLILLFFLYHAIIIDDQTHFASLKGSYYYVQGNFWKVLFAVFVGWGVPILLGNQLEQLVKPLLDLTYENFNIWLDPAARNWGMIFLYHLFSFLFHAMLYPILPCLATVLYIHVRNQKLQEVLEEQRQKKAEKGIGVVEVHLRGAQKLFYCPKCSAQQKAGMKKCYKCNILFKYKRH